MDCTEDAVCVFLLKMSCLSSGSQDAAHDMDTLQRHKVSTDGSVEQAWPFYVVVCVCGDVRSEIRTVHFLARRALLMWCGDSVAQKREWLQRLSALALTHQTDVTAPLCSSCSQAAAHIAASAVSGWWIRERSQIPSLSRWNRRNKKKTLNNRINRKSRGNVIRTLKTDSNLRTLLSTAIHLINH